jgi:alanine racemase
MRRFGALRHEALEIARFIAGHPRLRLRALFTHFACADEDDERPTAQQHGAFETLIDRLAQDGIEPEITHAANSAAGLRSSAYARRMVRLGIALYGLNPSRDVPIAEGMVPAMTLVSRVARVFDLAPGDRVSYGGTYEAREAHRAALVPIGYADGYDRGLTNIGKMYVRDVRSSVLGRVCMDQTVIRVSNDVEVGDPVVVAGAWDAPGPPAFDELAQTLGTINYEIAARIAARVPRYFVRGGSVVAISDLAGTRALRMPSHTNA